MVRKVYNKYARPLVRVVHGLPTSWEPAVATAYHKDFNGEIACSPCNRFIAVARAGAVEICDGATLMVLSTFKSSSYPACLTFSPDSRLLTRSCADSKNLVTWDLQTGSSVESNYPRGANSVNPSTHSIDGKMLAVVYSEGVSKATLIATHDLSTSRTRLHRVPEDYILPQIWTHGEFLRFATVKAGSITIWEAEFTLTHPPEVVESFPAPGELASVVIPMWVLFLPSVFRLAISDGATLSVWDVRDSKLLLKAGGSPRLTFSSDGHLFASRSSGEIHVWKESPAGYILHQKIACVVSPIRTRLSPNGESILVVPKSKIDLRHIKKDPILSSHQAQTIDPYDFLLAFSPDEPSVAFARKSAKMVTILDLQSGDPKLAIDTDKTVRGLGMTGSAIVAVTERDIRTWSLTAGDDGAKFTSDIILTATFDRSSPFHFRYDPMSWSVSPDLSRVVVSGYGTWGSSAGLEIYDTSTGKYLTGVKTSTGVLKLLSLWMYSRLLIKLEVEIRIF